MVEEEPPFEFLHALGHLFLSRTCATHPLAEVHKIKGICVVVADGRSLFSEQFQDVMRPHAAPPVFGVRGVGFASVHDRLPVRMTNSEIA